MTDRRRTPRVRSPGPGREHVAVQLPEAADLVARLRADARLLAGAADDILREAGTLAGEGIGGVAATALLVTTVADGTADAGGVLDAFVTELVALDGRSGPASGCYAGTLWTGGLRMPAWWHGTLASSGAAGFAAWRTTLPYQVQARPVTVHAIVQQVVRRRATVVDGPQVRRHVRREHYARSGHPQRVPHRVDPAPPTSRWGTITVPDRAATVVRRTVGPAAAGLDAVSAGQAQLERDHDRGDLGARDRVTRAATVGATSAAGGAIAGGASAKGGALLGAKLGAFTGPLAPAGVVVGAGVGAAAGGWLGSRVGESLGRAVVDRDRTRNRDEDPRRRNRRRDG